MQRPYQEFRRCIPAENTGREFPFHGCRPADTIPEAIFNATDGEILMRQTDDLMQTDSNAVKPTRRLSTWGLMALLLVPFAASAWYQMSDSQVPVLKIESARPSLLFSTYLYHHGEQPIEPTSQLKTEFRFRNDGGTPVHIQRVERSCGCMNPMLSSRDVNPGEIASLLVPISTVNEQPGPKEFMLTVHYTDPEPRQATLTIKAVFPEQKVFVEPKALFLSQRTSTEIPFTIRVSDLREERLQVTSVTSTADFVDAVLLQAPMTTLTPIPDPAFDEPVFDQNQVSEPVFDEPESSEILKVGFVQPEETSSADVQLLDEDGSAGEPKTGTSATIEGSVAGDLPPGRHHALVAVETTDPEFPVLTIPMMVTGPQYPVGEDVQMTSSVIQLVASEDAGARREGHIAFTAPAEWQLAEPRVWPAQLKVTLKTSPTLVPGRATTTVQVELTELPIKQLKEGVISIPTKDGKHLVTAKISFLWP